MRQVKHTEIQTFNFHGDDLAVVPADGEHYVVLARLCEPLGLRVDGQAEKLRALSWARTQKICVRDPRGQLQEVVCLSLRSVAGWLFTINAGKVAPHLREKLALYQRECADVLADHFLGKRGTIAPQGITASDLATALAPIAAGFEALTKMMVAMNDRLTAVEDRQRDGQILARERVNAIKKRVASCALDLGKYGVEKRRAASLRIHKRLKMAVGWFGDYCRLDNMPARHEADVLRALEIVEHETNGAVAAAQQLRFPALAIVGNNNAKRTSA